VKLYLGSRDYKPDGFLTVDIDPAHKPDILADVTDFASIGSGTVEEICASHILEHLPWPVAFKALAAWVRVLRVGGVLKIAVPDLALLCRLIAEGRNVWAASGLIFGVGRLENAFEAHQYGYTRDMLLAMLRALGMAEFDWWKHDLPDASNGWMRDDAEGRISMSLNISARKTGQPVADPVMMVDALMADRLAPFDQVVHRLAGEQGGAVPAGQEGDPLLTQRLHMMLIDARMRIQYLENALGTDRP
jgi:predicted SAM-dependent methyltransferase